MLVDESGILQRSDTIELIKNKLYFSSSDPPTERRQHHLSYLPFSLPEDTYFYTAFFADFGPLDLGLTCKFCQQLQEYLTTAQEQKKSVIFFTGNHPHKRANGAVLVLAYLILSLNYSVEQAYGPFIGIQPPFITFRDAGFCINTFPITVLDTAKAIRKAKTLNHINLQTFSVQNYQSLNKLQNGDVSWIVPGKFIAFSGPVTKRRQISPGVYTLTPEQYVPLMKNLGVTCIVRFNDKCYDRRVFVNNGIRHVDLFYEDGGNPSEGILQSFLQVCEQERGAIAVHCKAGLGRTGTNIAAYMMKHYGYTAREATAWCRICRPGSIVGPQQQFLVSIEAKMFHEGNQYRERAKGSLKESTDHKRLAANTSSNGTLASGVTDPGDASGRTTPLIFQQGSGKHSSTESLFKRDSRKENQDNNYQNQVEGLPPRSHSTGHTRPQSSSNNGNTLSTNSTPTTTPTHHNHTSSPASSTHNVSSISTNAPPATGHQQYQYHPKHEYGTASKDSNDAPAHFSSSYESSRSGKGYSSDPLTRPRSSSSNLPPSSSTNTSTVTSMMPIVRTGASSNSSAMNSSPNSIGQRLSLNSGTTALNAYSKGIQSTPKPSAFNNNNQWLVDNAAAGDVRRSLQFPPGGNGSNHQQHGENNQGVPLSRKDSKQAWNEKDLISAKTSSAMSSSMNSNRQALESPYLASVKEAENKKLGSGNVSSLKFTRHESPINGYSTNGSTSMPPIERPRSSVGTSKAHDFSSRRVITTRV